MRIFLDANVLFSASNPDRATGRMLTSAGKHAQIVTNPHAWEEARRNREAKRPALLAHFAALRENITISHAFKTVPEMDLPAEDIPVMAGAAGSQCDFLWTSDRRHFGPYYGKIFAGVKIVSSPLLADELLRHKWL
jgi:hypothetical protein